LSLLNDNNAASINTENFSVVVNTNNAMLKSLVYSLNPIIEKNIGNWHYDIPKCS
jgi:hypothetical protein